METEESAVVVAESHEEAVGIEPGLAAALVEVGLTPAALLGMPRECGVVHPQQFGVVRRSVVGADADALGHHERGNVAQCPAHLHQFPDRRHPQSVGHRPGRGQGAVRPKPDGAVGGIAGGAQQRGPDTATACVRVDDKLTHRVVTVAPRRQIEVAEHVPVLSDNHMIGALVGQLAQYLLAHRRNTVGSGGGSITARTCSCSTVGQGGAPLRRRH